MPEGDVCGVGGASTMGLDTWDYGGWVEGERSMSEDSRDGLDGVTERQVKRWTEIRDLMVDGYYCYLTRGDAVMDQITAESWGSHRRGGERIEGRQLGELPLSFGATD